MTPWWVVMYAQLDMCGDNTDDIPGGSQIGNEGLGFAMFKDPLGWE